MSKTILCHWEDVEIDELYSAIRQGYGDLETLKRYTGIGTGKCQGKCCVIQALRELDGAVGRRAVAAGDTEGFIKVIRDKVYSEILGAHIVGPHATELIAEFVLGRHLEATVEEMEKAMHPHPTLSEGVAEAALAALGRAIHI